MKKAFLYPLAGVLLPGLGQWLQGQKRKAITVFALVVFCFYAGLALDFDYYQRYEDILRKSHTLIMDPGTTGPTSKNIQSPAYNPMTDPYVRIDNLPLKTGADALILKGRARPGLAIEVSNPDTGEIAQIQAGPDGKFTLPPLPLKEGENRIVYGAANHWVLPNSRSIHIADYDSKTRYVPGRLDRIWHFIYKAVFPILNTPLLHFSGGYWQSQVLGWWQEDPLTTHQEEMPAPVRDVGFYFLVLVAMFQLIALFDAYDTAYNREVLDDIP